MKEFKGNFKLMSELASKRLEGEVEEGRAMQRECGKFLWQEGTLDDKVAGKDPLGGWSGDSRDLTIPPQRCNAREVARSQTCRT